MRSRTQIAGQFLNTRQLARRKAACVDRYGVHFVLLFPQPQQAERSVETAAESQKRLHSHSKRRTVVLSRKARRSRSHACISSNSVLGFSRSGSGAEVCSLEGLNEPS